MRKNIISPHLRMVENSPAIYRWGYPEPETKSVKRTSDTLWSLSSSRPLHGLQIYVPLYPSS